MTREKLLRYGKEYLHDLETACCKIDELHLNFVRESIKALEQETRKGHWMYDRANVRCSNCGKGYKDAFGRTSASTYNYCPNCGADMREVEEC